MSKSVPGKAVKLAFVLQNFEQNEDLDVLCECLMLKNSVLGKIGS